MKLELENDKRYVRMEATLYIEMKPGETQASAEDRFIDGLPDGIDIVSFRSEYWEPDEE